MTFENAVNPKLFQDEILSSFDNSVYNLDKDFVLFLLHGILAIGLRTGNSNLSEAKEHSVFSIEFQPPLSCCILGSLKSSIKVNSSDFIV